jgi:hypothetical protein
MTGATSFSKPLVVYMCSHEADGALCFRKDTCKGMNLLATIVLDSVSIYEGDAETYSWLALFKRSVAWAADG